MKKNLTGCELVATGDGTSVTSGLSHANGNCVVVTRLPDGRYTIADSKLGDRSPVWTLANTQFRRLGQLVIDLLTWTGDEMSVDLGDGALFTVRHIVTGHDNVLSQRRDGTFAAFRRSVIGTVFALAGESDLTFTAAEIRAFAWGFMKDQWPEGQPVKRLQFTV
jgi:hypothetical protein